MTSARSGDGAAPARESLLILALANFAIGFGAFAVVGILPPLADDLGLGPAGAGWVMTAYALAYAAGSPLGVALTGRMDRAAVMAGGLSAFGAGALLCALSPGFGTLMAGRVLMALGGGLVTPVAASAAMGLVPPERRGRALALTFGGLTLAQAVGVPAGTWAGYAFGWRATFLASAALALPAALLLRARLPRGLSVPVTGLADLGRALRRPDLAVAVGFTVLFLGGVWTLYTYFAAFLQARLGLGRDGVSAMLLLFGLGAVAGNAMGGRLSDAAGPNRTLALLCAAQVAIMPMLTLLPLGTAGMAVLVLAWSVAGWSFMVPQQARLAALEPALAPVLFALNAAAIYVATAMGSLAGGAVLSGMGMRALGPAGAAVVALSLVSLALAARIRR